MKGPFVAVPPDVAIAESAIRARLESSLRALVKKRTGGRAAERRIDELVAECRGLISTAWARERFSELGGILRKKDIAKRAQRWLHKNEHAAVADLLNRFSASEISVLSRGALHMWATRQIQAANRSRSAA